MRVDVIGGFLGSGKTTSILNLLDHHAIDPARTVILVNEYGQVGVDGALLDAEGGAVRELVSGCICCSLKNDFILQIQDIRAGYDPEYVVVEPSGVASMRDILQALTHPKLDGMIDEMRTVLVLDAEDYEWFVHMSPTYVDAQIGLAQLILVNKIDLSDEATVREVLADLERRNPHAVAVATTYGAFSWDDVGPLLPPLPSPEGPTARLEGYESYSAELPDVYDLEGLRRFFQDIADGRYGEVQRAKGVFHTADGTCTRLDYASHRVHETPWTCGGAGRVNVIGMGLDLEDIERGLSEAAGGSVVRDVAVAEAAD